MPICEVSSAIFQVVYSRSWKSEAPGSSSVVDSKLSWLECQLTNGGVTRELHCGILDCGCQLSPIYPLHTNCHSSRLCHHLLTAGERNTAMTLTKTQRLKSVISRSMEECVLHVGSRDLEERGLFGQHCDSGLCV